MTVQLSLYLFDMALILAMCLTLAAAAVLVGIRIGTQRLAIPIVVKEHALAQLGEENLRHMKARYQEQQHAWQRATLTAGLMACVAGALYLAYQHYSPAPHGLITFLLALIMMLFLASIASAGYHWGARIGMVQTFRRASASQMVELHDRLIKHPLPSTVTDLTTQLPKRKRFIHLMVVHYAINNAPKGANHEHA